jgi:acetyltransferase-like isoleucine patch superfamily enzyme
MPIRDGKGAMDIGLMITSSRTPTDPELRKADAIANSPQGDRSQRPAISHRPVVIEDDVWIGIGAMILKGVRIGNETGIYHGTFFDLGPQAEVVVGDWCSLVGVIVASSGRVEIGDYALLAHEVVLADQAAAMPPGEPSTPAAAQRRGDIWIGRNVWIGARGCVGRSLDR